VAVSDTRFVEYRYRKPDLSLAFRYRLADAPLRSRVGDAVVYASNRDPTVVLSFIGLLGWLLSFVPFLTELALVCIQLK